MSIVFKKSEKEEKIYLQQILSIIKDVIDDIDLSVKDQQKLLQDQKEYLWEGRMDIDAQEKRSVREGILNILAVGGSIIAQRERLGRMLNIPYFGRIDFCEKKENSETQPIYIGVNNFYNFNDKTNLIYDWRAPISGMYYDHELGMASYTSPSGVIEGNISLKRQYRIRNGIMEYMIENSVTVHDDILQKELSSNADKKMKSIVTTIQREQNRIIRNEDAAVLIIQGVAGSGKTSIALHRVAYLLYAHKDSLSSKDLLIISPNKVFADYISNVLPELGEENIPESSMDQILLKIIGSKYKFQTFFDQISELLDKPAVGYIERIRYKSTFDFITKLDKFILHVENTYFCPVDIKVKHITIPHEFIEEEFRRFYRYPLRQRFVPMIEHIIEALYRDYRIILSTPEKNILKKEIRDMFKGHNDLQLYKDFFEWAGASDMFKLRANHTLEYSDLAPLAYLRIAIENIRPEIQVKHLIIDEMQDYSPIQYKVLLKLYPCRKTVLGDASQSVNPYGSSTADMIQRAFVTGEVMKLFKSYRSTYEITNFAQKISYNKELEAVARHGEEPQIICFNNKKEEITGIEKLIIDFKKSDNISFGIICKDEKQASALYEILKNNGNEIYFLSSESTTFTKGIIITSASMAKGLEFDEVIVPDVDEKNYCSDIDRSILYVAVTRAMHRLTLTYISKLTEFCS